MNITEIIETYKIYGKIATRMDMATIGMNLCILIILLLQEKKNDKKIENSFILHIGVIILILVTEIISWNLLFKPQYFMIYKISVLIDYFLFWIIPITVFNLVKNVIAYKIKFDKNFIKIYFLLFAIFGILLFIPFIQNKLFIFNEERCTYKVSELNYYYYLIETILLMIGLILGLIKSKQIGIRDTIVGSIFIFMPIISIYIDEWWASTIGSLFITFALMFLFGITYQKRYEYVKDIEYKKQLELSETKTKLLLTQIQPHFLFNTLSTLKYLCETNPKSASNLCDDFSRYLRANIDAASDAGLVIFDKELQNIENYLKIEKARFDERVNYVFDIQERNFVVPVLSIQTIVENSVKKGICKKMEGGTITVSTKCVDNYVEIKISDDGAGFDMKTYMSDGKNHVGLTNTKQRLELINGTINVESEVNKGTTVTVLVPKGEE